MIDTLVGSLLFLLPGFAMSRPFISDRSWGVWAFAVAYGVSTSLFGLIGFAFQRMSRFDAGEVWWVSFGLALAVGVPFELMRRERSGMRTLIRHFQFVSVVPLLVLAAIRWRVYERRDRFPLGWDTGINLSFVTHLERFGHFPSFRLGEVLENYYYQGLFPPSAVMNYLSGHPVYTDVKLMSTLAAVGFVASSLSLIDVLLTLDRRERAILAWTAPAFAAFLVNSQHISMMLGLAIGGVLLCLVIRFEPRSVLITGLCGFGLVAVHPPSVQVVGLVVVALIFTRLLSRRARRTLGTIGLLTAVVIGAIVVGGVIHWVLAPELTAAEVRYALEHSAAISEGDLGANAAGVITGDTRSNLENLAVWLVPPLAFPFLLLGMGRAIGNEPLEAVAVAGALALPALVKISPTNGREYLFMFIPLLIVTFLGIRYFVQIVTGRPLWLRTMAGFLVVSLWLSGMARDLAVARAPEVGRHSYITLESLRWARSVENLVPRESVIAARYHPAVTYIQGFTGIRVIGGYRGLGPHPSYSDLEVLLDQGPSDSTSRAIGCRYGVTHVLVTVSDPAFELWARSRSAVPLGEGAIIVPAEFDCPTDA